MAYLLDANVFIQAKRLHYGMLRRERARFVLGPSRGRPGE
jgi:hypothetical protein